MEKEVRKRYDLISPDYQKFITDCYSRSVANSFSCKVGRKVLDVGCGDGFVTNQLAEQGLLVRGLDISRGMIKEAKKNFPHIDFRMGDMKSLHFYNNAFDGIFCFQTFQHISPVEQIKVLAEFYRVLKPGGILFMNTKNLFYPKNFGLAVVDKLKFSELKFGEAINRGKTKTYRYFSIQNELIDLVKSVGFSVQNKQRFNISNWIQVWAIKR